VTKEKGDSFFLSPLTFLLPLLFFPLLPQNAILASLLRVSTIQAFIHTISVSKQGYF